jgi:hypothetical protein
MSAIVLVLSGCLGSGGGSSGPAAAANNNAAASSCSASGLTGTAPNTAANGSFGTLTLSGAGATTLATTTFTSQSETLFMDPFAKMYAWGDVQLQSGVIPSTNVTTVNLTLGKTNNALLMVSIGKYGTTMPGNLWSAGSSVAGITVGNNQLTFSNAALPGITGSAVGSTITLNGSLCM